MMTRSLSFRCCAFFYSSVASPRNMMMRNLVHCVFFVPIIQVHEDKEFGSSLLCFFLFQSLKRMRTKSLGLRHHVLFYSGHSSA
jgi:hypothetical protein